MSAASLAGFAGFTAGKTRFTSLPNEFFSDLLPIIDDLAELKAVLYLFWRLGQGEGESRYVRLPDVLADLVFLAGLGGDPETQEARALAAFARAAQRGVLIEIEIKQGERRETWYFLNSDRGRQAVERLRRGEFEGLLHDIDDVVVGLEKERPTIFLLYEQNIGMVTPLLAEKLRQAERDYPENWIFDAFSLAVEKNARNWAYIQRTLRSWGEHGKDQPAQTGRSLAPGAQRDARSDEDQPHLFILE
ncbi:MAG: DnaD domain protein [Anaerolineales bacterium]|nr:DnaD domain protein [Anaerolineales bacterium]